MITIILCYIIRIVAPWLDRLAEKLRFARCNFNRAQYAVPTIIITTLKANWFSKWSHSIRSIIQRIFVSCFNF